MNKHKMKDCTSSGIYATDYLKESMLNPSKIQYKPSQLNMASLNCTQGYQSARLTPRTSRANGRSSKQNQFILPTFNITPVKESIKKDSSFTNVMKYKDSNIKPEKLNISNQSTTETAMKSNR